LLTKLDTVLERDRFS